MRYIRTLDEGLVREMSYVPKESAAANAKGSGQTGHAEEKGKGGKGGKGPRQKDY